MKMASAGRNTSQPVTIELTRIGPGVMGATLKRRRMPISRSITALIPAPKKPVPRMFNVRTSAKTCVAAPGLCAAPMNSPKPIRKTNGKR